MVQSDLTGAIYERRMDAPNHSIAALLPPPDPLEGLTIEIVKLWKASVQINECEMGSWQTFEKQMRVRELDSAQIKTDRTFNKCKTACRARAAKTTFSFGS